MLEEDPDDYQALVEAQAQKWTHTDELLALILEQLGVTHAAIVRLWAKEGTKAPDPIRYRRPFDPPPQKPRAATRAEIMDRIPVRR